MWDPIAWTFKTTWIPNRTMDIASQILIRKEGSGFLFHQSGNNDVCHMLDEDALILSIQ